MKIFSLLYLYPSASKPNRDGYQSRGSGNEQIACCCCESIEKAIGVFREVFGLDKNGYAQKQTPERFHVSWIVAENLQATNKTMTQKTIAERIKEITIELLVIDPEQAVNTARFIEDLHADSLDAVELIMEVEQEFDIVISDKDAERLLTIGDVIKYIEEKTSVKKPMKIPANRITINFNDTEILGALISNDRARIKH